MFATAVGLVARGRWRLCWFFGPYLWWWLIFGVLRTSFPDRFWTRSFFMEVQGVADLLKLGIALELWWRIFRLFSGAASAARKAALAILGVTAGAALTASLAGM